MKQIICLCVASLLVLTPLAMSIGPDDFLDGLVLYHPYDEGKGAKAEDLSGNEHEGEIDSPVLGLTENSGRHWNLAVMAAARLSLLKVPPQ